jgi:hypothetical protein
MTRNNQFAIVLVAAFAFFLAASSAPAQTVSAPMIVKSKPAPAEKPVKGRFEVLHMMINAIQVRNPDNMREIHTFVYSDQIRPRMQAMFNNSAYQYGDRVVIRYMPRSEVAVKIKGKPSKPV